ncbi:hypothetical protein NL676_008557 [Syzygium grande]|nr:hypothetical protein NL676_008557 [Syzygium grande]
MMSGTQMNGEFLSEGHVKVKYLEEQQTCPDLAVLSKMKKETQASWAREVGGGRRKVEAVAGGAAPHRELEGANHQGPRLLDCRPRPRHRQQGPPHQMIFTIFRFAPLCS